MFNRLSRRQKAALTAGLALLLWLPSGISTNTGPVVTGHSTFYNGSGFDPCLATIVGVMRTDVRWFNDMVLVERYGGRGTFVYITENGAPDPREQATLLSEGISYDFKDPNGAAWHVEEAFIEGAEGGYHASADGDVGGTMYKTDRTYVWIVELSAQPIYDLYAPTNRNDPNYHTVYNFVSIVDTCRFHREEATNYNGARYNQTTGKLDFNITHDTNDPYYGTGHKPDDGNHTHEAYLANIYVGERPHIVPVSTKATDVGWTSTWIVGGSP